MQTTVFCVDTYWQARPGQMERGQRRQFGDREGAMGAARRMARSRPGVMVYKVSGDPVADIWQPPEIVARFGETPTRVI